MTAASVVAGLVASLFVRAEHNGFTYPAKSVEELRSLGVPEPVILAGAKVSLSERIDAEAERRRARFITPGLGQSMEYDAVERQAEAALKAPTTATAAKYKMLDASIGVDIDPTTGAPATDVLGVARCVLAMRDAWIEVGAPIRKARLVAKAAIAAAPDVDAAALAASDGLAALAAL